MTDNPIIDNTTPDRTYVFAEDVIQLLKHYQKIKDPEVRTAVLALIERIAVSGEIQLFKPKG